VPSLLPPAVKELVDVGFDKLDQAIHIAGEDAIIAYIVDQYRRHIAPLDIPYVPEAIETTIVDPMAEFAIAHFVRKGHAAIHKDPAPVTPPA
jgi:hypothetical protein